METKFKVGDRVRIAKADSDGSNCSNNGVGYEFTIAEIESGCWCREHKGLTTGVHEKLLELIKSGSKKYTKHTPIKFALQYELDKDPTEYFADMKEVKKRIKELAERSDLKRDSIFIHEIKNTKKVTLGLSISIGK